MEFRKEDSCLVSLLILTIIVGHFMKSCGSNGAVRWWSGPGVVHESKTLVLNNLKFTPLVFACVTDVRKTGVGSQIVANICLYLYYTNLHIA